MPNASRRSVLAASLVIVSTPAGLDAPSGGRSSSDDPLIAMCARWWALRRAANPTDRDISDEESQPLCDALNELQDKISETPAISREGALAKMRIARHELIEGTPDGELDIVERVLASVLADASRLLNAS